MTGEFDLEHFVPISHDPAGRLVYDQLVYACHTCNLRKGARALADPSRVLTEESVRVHPDGRLSGLSDEASRIIAVLCMNSPNWVRWRLTWMRIVDLCQKHDRDLFAILMGYPEDLPDLGTLNPATNSRPEGVHQCHYARRLRGELPDWYVT